MLVDNRTFIHKNEFLIIGIFGTIVIGHLISIFIPGVPIDEGVFLYIGKSLGEGLLPYRDFWDHKMPGIYFITYILTRVTTSVGIMRLLMIGVITIAFGMFFRIAARGRTRELLPVLLMSLAVVTNPLFCGNSIMTEPFEGIFLFAGMTFLLRSYYNHCEKWAYYAFGGLLFGLALIVRPTALLYFPSVLFFIFFVQKNGFPRSARYLMVTCVFCVLPIIAVVLYVVHNGAYDDFLNQAFIANAAMGMKKISTILLYWSITSTQVLSVGYIVILAGIGISAVKMHDRRLAVFYMMLISTGFAEGLIMRKDHAHHFLPFLYLCIFPAAIGVFELLSSKNRWARSTLAGIILFSGLLLIPELIRYSALPALIFEPSMQSNEIDSIVQEIHGSYLWAGVPGAELYRRTDARPASKYFYITDDAIVANKNIYHEIYMDMQRTKPSEIVLKDDWFDNDGKLSGMCPEPLFSYFQQNYSFVRRYIAWNSVGLFRRR